MASIVYITDREMIEYHRLMGNRTMNFWRPGSMRKMSDFHPGDFLFFLGKGTERGIVREKGIVGYGRYKDNHSMSFSQMWNTYGTENGYATKESFKDAVIRVAKDHTLPRKMNGIELTDVVYFSAPIYLSEIGVEISNMIESYFYLDKNDSLATAKILKKAKEIGIDSWTYMLGGEEFENSSFEKDATLHIVSTTIKKLNPIYNENDQKKANHMIKVMMNSFKKQEIPYEALKGIKSSFVCLYQNKLEVFIPIVSNQKEQNAKYQMAVGHAKVLKELLKQALPEYSIEVIALVEGELSNNCKQILHLGQLTYQPLENEPKTNEKKLLTPADNEA